jgi:hypothetical protein
MRTAIFAVCFLCLTAAAFGQTAPVLSNVAHPMEMMDHVEHAAEHSMAQETSLFGASPYSYEKGEVPLADLGSPIYHTPLGDIAREMKKEHAFVKRAVAILEQ